jgi:hypothetical protein
VDSGAIGKAFAVRLSNCFSTLAGNQIIRRFGRRILVDRIIFAFFSKTENSAISLTERNFSIRT